LGNFFEIKVVHLILRKKCFWATFNFTKKVFWATFWAIFSQAYLVTLSAGFCDLSPAEKSGNAAIVHRRKKMQKNHSRLCSKDKFFPGKFR
jgi:hypothetical protein